MRAADVRRHRLRAQRLAGEPAAGPVEAVRALFGIQAQDRRAAMLAIRARTDGVSEEAVERALEGVTGRAGDRRLVRAWAMRGTLHLLAAEDLPTALAVFAPLHLARGQRRLTQLGLPPDLAERSTAEAAAVLAEEGPLTRRELAARLGDRGVPVAAEGQAAIHVVRRAALAGVLIEVGEDRYGLLDLGPLPDRENALVDVARRYAASHAPATAEDFATWSGLPAADVRAAWHEPEVAEAAEPGGIRLLPAFDEWLLGWASRNPILPREHAERALPGGGIIRPVAIADGCVFATWRLDRAKRRIELEPFGRVTKAMRPGIEAEVAAIGAFLGSCLALWP